MVGMLDWSAIGKQSFGGDTSKNPKRPGDVNYSTYNGGGVGYAGPLGGEAPPPMGMAIGTDPAPSMISSDPIEGLKSADPGAVATPAKTPPPEAGMGGGAGMMPEQAAGANFLNSPGSLRQGIGQRTPPQLNAILAGLGRAY